MMFCIYVASLLISFFGAKMIVNTGIFDSTTGAITNAEGFSTGDLSAIITYGVQILSSLMMLAMVFVMITSSRASAERIVEVLEEESDLANGSHPLYTVPNGEVTFRNVSFSYAKNRNKLCLKNVNLHIPSGSTVGIIGGTGSSKTSLVQLIPRLYDATEGTVLVGARMCASMIWRRSAMKSPWFYRKMSYSPAPLKKTFAGAVQMPATRSSSASAG